jgi:hypothetical protein
MVLNRKINGRWPVAYKEYNDDVRDAADMGALKAMVALIPALPGPTAEWLATIAAWPAAMVERGGRVSGFLMRAVPDEYYFDYPGFGGRVTRKLATAEFLLNDDSYASSIGLHVDERERLQLLADLAAKVSRLHALGIAVGDLSPKNLLFAAGTAGSSPSCFLIDCDAMRINGRSVLPQAETPDWQVPAGEEKGTPRSDAYKLALVAVRLFARDQASRDPGVLPAGAEPKLAELADAALNGPAGDRPAPAEWAEYCQSAAASPRLVITPPAAPAPASPARGGLTARAWQALVGGVAAVAVIVLVVVAATSGNGGKAALGSATTTTPAYTYTPPDSTVPTDSPVPTEVQTTPASDPNSASTDLTPFTYSALLPESFTDSNGYTYTLESTSAEQCVTSNQTSTVQNILSRYGCTKQMTGSYVNSNGTMLVSVQVMPLSDQGTAAELDSAMSQAKSDGDLHAGNLGDWCPQSGTGSVCNNSGFGAATKEGSYTYNARYFINADALWINLSQDTSSTYEGDLETAATAAVTNAGPENYSGNP